MFTSRMKRFLIVGYCFVVIFFSEITLSSTEEVVVVSKKIKSFSDWLDNSSYFSISKDDLLRVDPQHPKEIFQRVPGVWISRGSGQEHLTSIRSPVLTGPGACGSFLLLEDSIPVRPKGFCNVNGLFELFTEEATALEVIKGPASARFGGNALHGVINVVSSQQLSDEKRAMINLGPNNYINLRFSYGEKDKFKIKSYLSNTKGIRRDSGLSQQKFQIRTKFPIKNLSGQFNLIFSNLNQETAGYIYGLQAYKDSKKIKTNNNPEAFRDANSIRFNIKAEKKKNSNLFSILSYLRKTNMEFLQHYLPGTPLEDNDHTSIGVIQNNIVDKKNHQLIYGVHLELAKVNLFQFQLYDLTNSSPFNNAVRPKGFHYDYKVNTRMGAIFLGFKGGQFKNFSSAFGDIRLETLHYDYKNRMISGNTRDDGSQCSYGGCFYNRPKDRSDTYQDLSFRLGADKNFDRANFFIQISSGFRPPQINEVYRLQKSQFVTDLTSEEIVMLESGLKLRFDYFNGKVSLYKSSKENSIFRDANNFTVDDGKSKHTGVEIFGSIQIAQSILNLSLSFEEHKYNFSSSTSTKEQIVKGNYVDTSPKFKGNISWTFNINDSLLTELEIERMGSYFTDAANKHKYEGHNLMHLRTSFTLEKGLRLYLRINNLKDKLYAERADFNVFGGERYFPGISRQTFIGLECNF